MLAGIALAREIAAAEPFASVTGRPLRPSPDTTTTKDIAAWLRANVETVYQCVGTARIGAPGDGAVGASVISTIARGNTDAPAIMIVERAAELIAR